MERVKKVTQLRVTASDVPLGVLFITPHTSISPHIKTARVFNSGKARRAGVSIWRDALDFRLKLTGMCKP